MIDPDASRNSEQAARAAAEQAYKDQCTGEHMTADEYAAFEAGWDAALAFALTRERAAWLEERERLYELLGPVLRYAQGMVTADGPDCKCELCKAWADVQRRAPAGDAGPEREG